MKIKPILKQLTILAAFLIPALVTQAQTYNNIEFIENKGQWDSRVKYMGDINSGAFFIRPGGFTVLKHNDQDFEKLRSVFHDHNNSVSGKASDDKIVVRSHAYNVDFVGAAPNLQIVPEKVIPTYNNYFLGNDPSKWASKCRIFQAITFKDVYPNVDVRYYTDNGTLKYDIVAKPGADISKIALRYDGVDKMQVKDKQLVVTTSVGELKESYPYTYQSDGKVRKEVTCKYVVKNNIVTFDVKNYDRNATLVIDPFLRFCSFSGSSTDNWGFTATYGPDGSFYGGGIVRENNGFPVSNGAFQTIYQGGSADHPGPCDIGIIKLTDNGANRVYATYIGGSANEQPHSLVVNAQGELVLAGRTGSANYPMIGAAIGPAGGYDIVVTKLNADGTGLIGSKRIGGSGNDGVNIKIQSSGTSSLHYNYGDGSRSEVIFDGAGNICVASSTQSNDFPLLSAFQGANGGGLNNQDGVILRLLPDVSALTFSTYIGGNGNDAAYVLSVNPANGDLFVAGGTESTNFPGDHTGVLSGANNGGVDGFIAQLTGNTLVRTTYVGTNGYDQIYGIQFDRVGFPYIMGQTTGNWPVINAAYSNAGSKQFIAKLQPNLSNYIYSTVFGTASSVPNISPIAFLVDRCENVYVSGWGGEISTGYSSAGTTLMPITPDAIKPTTDGKDFYFFVLQRDAASQLYGSFFGQTGGLTDHVDGGTSRFDQNGVIYQSICANCEGPTPPFTIYPTTTGAWSTVKPSTAYCNLAMVKMSFNLAGVGSDVGSAINGVPNDTAGCFPLTVVFTDQVRNAIEYIWNFGDGGPDVGPLPAATGYTQPYTYNTPGTYRVMLVAIDPASCNVRDTSYINIRVGDLRANLAASFTKLAPCEQFNYRFDNLSTPSNPIRPFTNTSFTWKFGDGSAPVVAGTNSVNHTYPAPGTYTAWLILNDTAYCNNPDSISLEVRVAANVDAQFETPPTGCAPYDAVFNNTSAGGQTFQWNFGDPASGANNTSTAINPTHIYNIPGTYQVVMVATDLNTCNITDTARFTIVVYDKPTADFSYTPVAPVENTPNIFTNLSSTNATRFKWVFGDGDTLLTTSRAPVEHQYNATGTFNACLIAFNEIGCSDTLCRPVTTIVVPALDVPNAFTPNSGDINSRVLVRGFGIAKMRFIIWNRWGQRVFETGNRFEGWDGRVKGVVQPMDVYAYTLDVEFFDGKKATKKGDITLIR